jgi:hypothetical protein
VTAGVRSAALGALGLALLACAAEAPAPKLSELHGVADLQKVFDGDIDHPRLVLLLSPT